MDDRVAMSVAKGLSPQHQAPLPSPTRRRRWLTLLMALVVFVSGVVCGVGIGMEFQKRHFLDILRHPERGPERIVTRMRSQLQLDDRQTQQVRAIVARRVAVLDKIYGETVNPLLAKQLELFRAEVAEVLNPEQQAEWDKYTKPLPQKWFPTAAPKPSSPKAAP
jgi:hypothetical protein